MRNTRLVALALVVAIACATPVFAAGAKDYQVTGPIVEITNDKLVVMKGKDKWEVGRDAASKVPADLKVGDKVTIYYKMTATEVESKAKPATTSTTKKTKKAA